MRRYLTLRLLQSLVLLLLVSMIGFAILHLAPGGPMSQFMAGGEMSPEDIARVERQLGYKHAKYVMAIDAVASLAGIGKGKGGYWEDNVDYDWYAGI